MLGRNPDRRRTAGGSLFAAFLIIATLYFAREVFIPLALAGLIAFLLAPFATRLERWGLHRTIAGLLVISLSLAAVSTIGWVVLGQVYNLAVELPQYQQNVTSKIDALHLHSAGRLTSTVQMLSEVSKQISSGSSGEALPATPVGPIRHRRSSSSSASANPGNAITNPASDAAHKPGDPVTVRVEEPETSLITVAAHDVEPLIHPLTTSFVIVIFVIFMLLARDDLRDRAVRLVGSSRIHITTVAMTDAGTRVSRYLLMQFVVNMAYGGIIGFGLWAIGVPHPLLWAVTTALLRFIPYVGILAAGAGPVLVALAVSPHWSTVAWTFGLYAAMELISANAVEPWLYGSSTGISALAILIAAIFWTWLWGIAGLLLSTPLTVCLIVLGRHVPRLEFIGVLFGEEDVLDPPQRLYQRILSSDFKDAARLIDDELKTQSREAVYDAIIIPALSLIEEARHAEELPAERAEQALHGIEELVEEHWASISTTNTPPPAIGAPLVPDSRDLVLCVAVRDLADEITCELLARLASDLYQTQVLDADLLSADVIATIEERRPAVLCVVGLPPQAIRHVRLRCHQLRTRFPDLTIVACIFSVECDLSNIRSRIPLADANHVVCSLLQAREYLTALATSAHPPLLAAQPAPEPPSPDSSPVSDRFEPSAAPSAEPLVTPPSSTSKDPHPVASKDSHPVVSKDPHPAVPKEPHDLDITAAAVFDQIAKKLARAFDAPIAILSVCEGGDAFWQAQCGLSDAEAASALQSSIICRQDTPPGEVLIVPDTALDDRFRDDAVLREKTIRFFAEAPIFAQQGRRIGCICVLDTRPRQVTDQQRDCLLSLTEELTNAIEIRSSPTSTPQPEHQPEPSPSPA